jgi:NAD(P)-dependent dehydrogenase (short-subunit alcohol dehydrogenase family)
MSSLAGKTAVITGATSGIGRATAVELARRGARLLLVGRNEARARETLEAIRAVAPKCDAEVIRGDFAAQAEVRRVGEELARRVDSLDLLVNNHGVTLMRRELTPDGFEATFAINHLGYFHLTGILPRLLATPGRASWRRIGGPPLRRARPRGSARRSSRRCVWEIEREHPLHARARLYGAASPSTACI